MKKIKIILATFVLMIGIGAQTLEAQNKVVKMSQDEFYQMFVDEENEACVNNGTMAIVDFNAEWCGPCKRLAPILEELADEYEGIVRFYSINTDHSEKLVKALDITGIPFLLFIMPGVNNFETNVGFIEKEDLKTSIDNALINGSTGLEDDNDVVGNVLVNPTGDIDADVSTIIDLMLKCLNKQDVDEDDLEITMGTFEDYYKDLGKINDWAMAIQLAVLNNEELMNLLEEAIDE